MDKTSTHITTYHDQMDVQNILQLREVLTTLPVFSKSYFRAMEPTTSTKTRLSYAYDIRTFFRYLQEANPLCKNMEITNIPISVLDQLEAIDIEEYQEYLKVYDISEKTAGSNRSAQITNGERGLKRKMSALRSFYAYFYKRQMIQRNPTLLVDMPKLHEKAIVRLDDDETAALLDYIEHGGDKLTGQKKMYYEKTKTRDLAIVTLLLGTGIRVSECVGLDIQDVDFKNGRIKVIRKGGSEMYVYFGEEVETALCNYLDLRDGITPVNGEENALFYSTQKKRIGVQAVENMVKKYAREITTTKKITPHKLRSTYGTALYRETGDIYLVADVLGHKDVNTTKKHYAAMDDNRRRSAASAVHLREK
ncbi:MAG: tyrosine-type recombinase/integrase [Lachnospiraceae bacterium]|nr:tyrosine-type recombinase/integrase [Lachnospiraceae bacterium]